MGAAILNLEPWVVEDPLTSQPEIPIPGGVSDDIVGRGTGKSDFLGKMERTMKQPNLT